MEKLIKQKDLWTKPQGLDNIHWEEKKKKKKKKERNSRVFMGYHEKTQQHSHHMRYRMRIFFKKSIFKKNNYWSFSNLRKYMNLQVYETHRFPISLKSNNVIKTYYNQIIKKKWRSSKGKEKISNTQWNPYKVLIGLLGRNFASQDIVGW